MSDDHDDADKTAKSAASSDKAGSGKSAESKAAKVSAAKTGTDPVVPTGKAGRGSVVQRRVRTDADTPEDTDTKRANPVEYVGQVIAELRKVIWPTKMQMATYTAVVFIFLIFMTALVNGVDFGAGKLVELSFGR